MSIAEPQMGTVAAATDAMADADPTRALARFAAALGFGDMPPHAVALARACLLDAVACALFGARFPWSQSVVAATTMPAGPVAVPGAGVSTDAATAALLSGVFAHAFELDSLRKPGAGVHPGATVALPALAVARQTGASGGELIAAIVAGIEVMFRIGAATLHSAESRGFHAPGITGVFGAAVAAGKLRGLDAEGIHRAMAISGSMSGGLLRFAAAGDGGMIKRLHLGRAARSGVEAAQLAAAGFEGPSRILDGRFGVLEVFCARSDTAKLTAGLGRDWEIEKLCIKRYACHVTAQAPVQMLGEWRVAGGFVAEDVVGIHLEVPEKLASHHGQKHPPDLALAQYSLPFMLAFSLVFDLGDPATLTPENIADGRVHAVADRISLVAKEELSGWAVRMSLRLADGRTMAGEAKSFSGCPETPFEPAQLRARCDRLAAAYDPEAVRALFDALENLEGMSQAADLPLPAGPAAAA